MKKEKKTGVLFLLGIGLVCVGVCSEPTSVVLVAIGLVLIVSAIVIDF